MLLNEPQLSSDAHNPIRALVVSESMSPIVPTDDIEFTVESPWAASNADRMGEFDLVLVLGSPQDEEAMRPLVGATKLALRNGATIVYGAPGDIGILDVQFLAEVCPAIRPDRLGEVRHIAEEPRPHPAFTEFLTMYGQTKAVFRDLPEDGLPLAFVTLSPVEIYPAAADIPVSNGRLILAPYRLTAGQSIVVPEMVRSIWAYLENEGTGEEQVFETESLPGEAEQVEAVGRLRSELELAEESLREIRSHRQLIGTATGDAFVRLAIKEMNFIAAAESPTAVKIPEDFREDFRIVSPNDEVLAIAEAKGVNRGIHLKDVNQVNSHRTEKFERSVEELPGVLVVNQFRLSPDIEMRKTPVSARVANQAKHMNVIVIRSWDLLDLVRTTMTAGRSFDWEELLRIGGGWLTVSEGRICVDDGNSRSEVTSIARAGS